MAKSASQTGLATTLVALFTLGLFHLGTAAADEGAVDYRQHTLQAMGGHLQAAVDILRQKVPHSEHMVTHAQAMADLAEEIVPTLFPEGSQGGDALPAIWEEPDDFAERVSALREAAAAFNAAAASGDSGAIGEAFQGLGQACKNCHDNYRAE